MSPLQSTAVAAREMFRQAEALESSSLELVREAQALRQDLMFSRRSVPPGTLEEIDRRIEQGNAIELQALALRRRARALINGSRTHPTEEELQADLSRFLGSSASPSTAKVHTLKQTGVDP